MQARYGVSLVWGGLLWFCCALSALAQTIEGQVKLGSAPCKKCGPLQSSVSETIVFTDDQGQFRLTFKPEQLKTKITLYFGKKVPEREVCQIQLKGQEKVLIQALFVNANDPQIMGAAFEKAECAGQSVFPMMPPVPPMPPIPGLPPTPGRP